MIRSMCLVGGHMTTNLRIPAAQYGRMSTEHQRYSLENQFAAIQRYAEAQGFEITQTYVDPAKSGLVLRHRPALRQMLQDVVSGSAGYQAILVYDVSRWGRFQDTDESAHYEFLCKSAGVPVHYCAEIFANDGSLTSLIMKALKRTMAGEYSRELSVKVFEGHKRLARLGFKQGGLAGYGFRRFLLSSDGTIKQQLADGECKSIATDRVALVPGPQEEIEIVREIFRLFVQERYSVLHIVRELNRRGVKREGGEVWKHGAVRMILTHPKYTGCHVYGRTSQKLCTSTIRLPKGQWTTTPFAFAAIVDQTTFDAVQEVKDKQTKNQTNPELLGRLRALLVGQGRLSYSIVTNSPDVPSPSTYRLRFGSLRRAYELVGYGKPEDFGLSLDIRRRTQALREQLINQLQATFPEEVRILGRGGRQRSLLQLDGFTISVRTARSDQTATGILKWIVDAAPREREYVTLLARLTPANDGIHDLHIFGRFKNLRFSLRQEDKWLDQGIRLHDLMDFCKVSRLIQAHPR
jgi:DNA invertase Pin-like site-specific DNA recombinase